MHIVRALLDGPLGFNELGRAVGGCNPATLKVRLDHLEDLGLLRRTVHSQMPPRTSYELAPAGVDLQRVIDAIDALGARTSRRRRIADSTRSRAPLSADRSTRHPSPGRARRRGSARGGVRIDVADRPRARRRHSVTGATPTRRRHRDAVAHRQRVRRAVERARAARHHRGQLRDRAGVRTRRPAVLDRALGHREGLAERRVAGSSRGCRTVTTESQRQLQRTRPARPGDQPDVHDGPFRLRLLLRRELQDPARHPLVRLRRHRERIRRSSPPSRPETTAATRVDASPSVRTASSTSPWATSTTPPVPRTSTTFAARCSATTRTAPSRRTIPSEPTIRCGRTDFATRSASPSRPPDSSRSR